MAETEHTNNPIRFGILGCAMIARKFCRAVSLLPVGSATISAVASRSLDKAQSFVDSNSTNLPSSVKILSSYESLLDETSIDAVYIPLPTSLHVEWAVKAAERRKHVLLEKPAAICAEDLERILESCANNGVFFMDGTMWVHHPRTAEMKRAIDDPDWIGELRLIYSSCSFLATSDFLQTNIRVKPDLDSLGALGDLGWYCIGSILFCTDFNLPQFVVASPSLHLNPSNIILSCTASLHWPNRNLIATMYCSFLSHISMDLSLHGSRGTILVKDLTIPYKENEASFDINSGAHFAELHIGWSKKPEEVRVRNEIPQEGFMVLEFAKEAKKVRDEKLSPSLKWAEFSRKTQLVLDAVKKSIDDGFQPVYLW
ncbi:hypothetical protein LUZ60_004567 [Juncus effusus]|nr:hypothetical protein LUZ60_004567 [Juncus effusus]